MRAGFDVPLPPVDEVVDHGGEGSGWIALARARDDIDAHLMTGRLNAAGVETSMVKDFGNGAWLFGGWNPRAPVTVLVKRLQIEDARLVMAEISFDSPAAEPDQGVEDRRHPWMFPLAWWIFAVALGALMMALSFVGMASGQSDKRCEIPIICGRN